MGIFTLHLYLHFTGGTHHDNISVVQLYTNGTVRIDRSAFWQKGWAYCEAPRANFNMIFFIATDQYKYCVVGYLLKYETSPVDLAQ